MNANTSDIFPMLPPWISMASKTGPLPILIPPDADTTRPTTRPRTKSWQDGELRRHPDGRPITLRALPTITRSEVPEELGAVRRGSPPPDLMRVASSFGLLGALLVALSLSWAVGG